MPPLTRTKTGKSYRTTCLEQLAALNTRNMHYDGIIPATGTKIDLDECVKVFRKYQEDVAAGRIKRAPRPANKRMDDVEKAEEAEFRRQESEMMKRKAMKRALEEGKKDVEEKEEEKKEEKSEDDEPEAKKARQ